MPLPLVIAHRGDPVNELENSLRAVDHAIALGVDMVEVDVRMSRDGSLFIMHDATTRRTAAESVSIERSPCDRIRKVRLRNGEPVPTLEALVDRVSGACGLNLEIKSTGAGAAAAAFLRERGYSGRLLISSFQEAEVVAARRVSPELETAVIFDDFNIRRVATYREKGYRFISLRKSTVDQRLIQMCHDYGIQVFAWTVDQEKQMHSLIRWGVDGIYSNNPELLMRVREKVNRKGHES